LTPEKERLILRDWIRPGRSAIQACPEKNSARFRTGRRTSEEAMDMQKKRNDPAGKQAKSQAVVIAAVLLLICCSGCLLDPRREGPDDINLEPLPFDSPANTLYNFSLAHTLEDAVLYADCLSESYRFMWEDPDTVGTIYWNRNDDVNAMENLFDAPEVLEIVFEYTVLGSTGVDFAEPVDTLEYSLNIDFSIIEAGGGSYAYGFADFTFDASKPDSVSILTIYDRTGS